MQRPAQMRNGVSGELLPLQPLSDRVPERGEYPLIQRLPTRASQDQFQVFKILNRIPQQTRATSRKKCSLSQGAKPIF